MMDDLITALSKHNGMGRRVDNSKQLLRNFNFIRKHGYHYLIRGNGQFAGVVIDRKKVLDESSGQRKEVIAVMRPDGKIETESLCIFDKRINSYKDVYYELGDIFLLTSRTSPEDDMNLMDWLPPSEALPITDLKEHMRVLEVSFREMSNHAEEVEHSLKMERLIAKQSQEIVVSLETQINEMTQSITTMQGEVQRLRSKQQTDSSTVSAIKEQVNEMMATMVKMATNYGKEPYELTIDVLDKTQKISDILIKMTPETQRQLQEKMAVISGELSSMKDNLEKIADQQRQAKEQSKLVPVEIMHPQETTNELE